jgi:predicted flap endonuclease-1-like 5' DNA nuclease
MQILVCLLIAGLIGMIIGWLLRGNPKKLLEENDKQWENKIINTNNEWEQKVQGLLDEHNEAIQEADFKIINFRETINRAKNKIAKLEQRLSEANDNLAQANSNIIAKEDEVKRLRIKVDNIKKELDFAKKDLENVKATHQSEIKEWQLKLDNANQEYKQEAQSLLGDNQNRIDTLEQELENTKKAYKLIQVELRSARSKLSQKGIEDKDIDLTKQKLISLEKELNQAKDKIRELHSEKDSLEEELKVVKNSVSSSTDNKTYNNNQNEFDIISRLYEWKKRYKATKKELDDCQSGKSNIHKLSNPTAKLLLSNNISTENEEEEVETSKPALLKEAKDGKKDNLTLVKGIGKVLEDRLNDLGIFHFEQIASWTKTEQAWIDKYMSFPGRVEREEWVQQAKKLLKGIETEFAKRVKSGDVPSSKKE